MRDIVVGSFNAPLYPGLQISGMTNGAKAFTLIELLVVVLIIGILASVALPQYQKAVEKSRATQAISLVKSVAQAQQAYYLANGTWATSFDELSVEIPWTGTERWSGGASSAARSNEDWSLQLYRSSNDTNIAVSVGRLTGKYKGAGFMIYTVSELSTVPLGELVCAERHQSGVTFDGNKGDYCEKLFHATYITGTESTGNLPRFRM